uniref:Zinc finger protein ZIC 5 n=1 Tax=Xiphophorus couchianus TaxID=32473 RepID=A0A3B5MCY2_9TELE
NQSQSSLFKSRFACCAFILHHGLPRGIIIGANLSGAGMPPVTDQLAPRPNQHGGMGRYRDFSGCRDNRSHAFFASYQEQAHASTDASRDLGSQMMLGLPGDLLTRTHSYGQTISPKGNSQQIVTQFLGLYKPLNMAIQRGGADAFLRCSKQTVKHELVCKWSDGKEAGAGKLPCSRAFGTMYELVTHVTVEHVGGPEHSEYICHWENCARDRKPFKAKYKLVNHVRVHTGEKPFPCPFHGCEKVFARSENLKIHKRTHTEQQKKEAQQSPIVHINQALYVITKSIIKHIKNPVNYSYSNSLQQMSSQETSTCRKDQIISNSVAIFSQTRLHTIQS